jgi:hypothetical protein
VLRAHLGIAERDDFAEAGLEQQIEIGTALIADAATGEPDFVTALGGLPGEQGARGNGGKGTRSKHSFEKNAAMDPLWIHGLYWLLIHGMVC